jgi:hypothetical protein
MHASKNSMWQFCANFFWIFLATKQALRVPTKTSLNTPVLFQVPTRGARSEKWQCHLVLQYLTACPHPLLLRRGGRRAAAGDSGVNAGICAHVAGSVGLAPSPSPASPTITSAGHQAGGTWRECEVVFRWCKSWCKVFVVFFFVIW